jgi:adenine specific DNA methylase Mod
MPVKDQHETKFFSALKDIFVGAKIEGDSGFINLMAIKSSYYQAGVFPVLKKDIDHALLPFPEFREELFDKLYTFFQRYFSESGSIYFRYTSLHQNVYEKVYTDDRDVILFWKTHMLYYVKTDRIFRSVAVEVEGTKFFFDASKMSLKKSNEKREVIYEFRKLQGQDGTLIFDVDYSERGRVTKMDEILKETKKVGLALNEDTLSQAFRIFEKQSEVDFFINKDARSFLQEQFDLWLYQYMFDGQNIWSAERIAQLQVLKEIAYKVIGFISQFEDELVKVWNKPKFVLNSHYVLTLDKLIQTSVFDHLLSHTNFPKQVQEWRDLGMLDKNFRAEVLAEKDLTGEMIHNQYKFLPIDTKYFPDLELEILAIFQNLDTSLDGWLIHSENYQALSSILKKFHNKIQSIYIDPPFNLDKDADFAYNVNYKDSTWISLLENRLNLAKALLTSSGTFFLRCDNNGNSLVRQLMDEKFDKTNFRNELIINRFQKKSDGFTNTTESLFLYSVNGGAKINKLNKPRDCIFCHQALQPQWQWSHSAGESSIPKYFFIDDQKKLLFPPRGRHWTNGQEEIDKLEHQNRIRINYDISYTDVNGNRIDFIPEKLQSQDVEIDNNWTDLPGYEFGVFTAEKFSTQNSESLLKRFVLASTDENEMVLDYFLGSGTTSAVAQKLKRKWVGIEMGDHFYDIVLPRMKRVISFDKTGISKDDDVMQNYNKKAAGGFFKYFDMEQYEDVLRRAKYEDSTLFENPNADPYHSYVFLRDLKMLDSIEIEPQENKVHFHPERLYPDPGKANGTSIDLAETLSQRTGKWIKRITADYVEFQDGERMSLTDPDWQTIKPLVWWQ